jgi:hypothetical protein
MATALSSRDTNRSDIELVSVGQHQPQTAERPEDEFTTFNLSEVDQADPWDPLNVCFIPFHPFSLFHCIFPCLVAAGFIMPDRPT